jgi:hypothetical protein
MATVQDSIGKKDFKLSEAGDLVLTNYGPTNDLKVIGGSSFPLSVLAQLVQLCLKTKIQENRKYPIFGASPRGIKTKMIQKSITDLKSYIAENIRKSGINPNNYPIKVDAFPIGKESLAINVAILIPSSTGLEQVGLIISFDETAQAIRTIKAFGV